MTTFLTSPLLRRRSSRAGFTMIELLVVATIMIVLTTIGLVSYQRVNRNARNGKRKADLEAVRQSLVLYRTDNGYYPRTTSFATMLTAIGSYLGSTTVQDPLNTNPHTYTYTTTDNGVTFTMCARPEPSTEPSYCVGSP